MLPSKHPPSCAELMHRHKMPAANTKCHDARGNETTFQDYFADYVNTRIKLREDQLSG